MANLIDTIVKGTLRVVGSIYGKIWAQAGGSGNQGNVVVSQSDSGTNRSTSITNASASSGSEVGSVYQDSNWWSWINVRHRNGYSDGNHYGMYIKSLMTADGSLIWNKNYNGAWTDERTILDSNNFVSHCNSYYVAKAGDTMTGTLVLSKTTDAAGNANNSPALIVGGTATQAHIEIDANEVIAKADGTSMTNLYLNEKAIIRTNGAIETYNTVRVGATNVGTGGCVMQYNATNKCLEFTF